LTLHEIDSHGRDELLSLTLHPEFDRTRFVFLVYTAPGTAGDRMFHVARFREVGGRLAERAILLDGVPAARTPAAASVRFGPDERLYVSFDDGGAPALAASLGSFRGKVLRMTESGALPDDNPLPSLVYSPGHRSPGGFDWQPATQVLWVADRDAGERDVLRRVTPGRINRDADWLLSSNLQPGAAGAAFYTGAEPSEWRGNLFVAAADGAHLLRVRFDGTIRERENSPPSGLRLRPDSRAFAQGEPGRRLERRAERGVETGGSGNRLPPARYERTRERS
jgi:glucose/arabinose dehydrogenase